MVGRHMVTRSGRSTKPINTIHTLFSEMINQCSPWNESSDVPCVKAVDDLHIVSITASSLGALYVEGLPPNIQVSH